MRFVFVNPHDHQSMEMNKYKMLFPVELYLFADGTFLVFCWGTEKSLRNDCYKSL